LEIHTGIPLNRKFRCANNRLTDLTRQLVKYSGENIDTVRSPPEAWLRAHILAGFFSETGGS